MNKLTGTVKAIVFDLDDTLYPEIQYVRSGFRVVAGKLTRPGCDIGQVFDLLWNTFENGPRNRVFNEVLSRLDMKDDPQIIAELVGIYRCHRPNLQLEPDVRNMLEKLRRQYQLGLITDGFLPTQKLKVEALRLQNTFDEIIYTEELGREFWKPSPVAFENISAALNCPAEYCLYIADNPTKDFIAPNQLDWHTVQVTFPGQVHAHLPAADKGQPQVTINETKTLLSILP